MEIKKKCWTEKKVKKKKNAEKKSENKIKDLCNLFIFPYKISS